MLQLEQQAWAQVQDPVAAPLMQAWLRVVIHLQHQRLKRYCRGLRDRFL